MSTGTLAKAPIEIQDAILTMLDSPKDLLSFALTSKHFYTLIVPFHIQFRVIVCDLWCNSLWKRLAERPLLCSRIRILRLFDTEAFDD
ncbi:hypothetical protein M422DRAFT_157122, partial [Sphaerobolus stellatus SS14]